jgi:hypothetical protein
MTDSDLEAWIAARPPLIRHLARQYPPGQALDIDGERWYVVSYEENERIGISRIDPSVDYKASQRRRELINAHDLPGYRPFSTDEHR